MEDKKLLGEIHHLVDDSWQKLGGMWLKIGHDSSNIHKRKKQLVQYVQELLHEMVEVEGVKVTEKEKFLSDLISEIAQLAKELTLDSSVVSEARNQVMGKTLLEAEEIFLDIATDLRKRKGIRMEKYLNVNNQIIALSDEMGDTPFTIEFEGIPSDAQVALLEKNLVQLQREKIRRQNLFKTLKRSLIKLFEHIERFPRNELERLISCDGESEIKTTCKVLSLKVLKDLQDMEDNMKQEISTNTFEGEGYWQKIRELWSRLTVDEEVRMAFEKVHKGVLGMVGEKKETIYKPSILKGLQSELRRLEEEKRKNMALFIQQVREELQQIWVTQCFMDNIECRFYHDNYGCLTDFDHSDFTSDLYTEELLEKHEKEVEYWRSFVERNKKIIDGIFKRDQMFTQYREMDQKSDDPSRLANRGGALLKEEKERKMLEKTIPKLENTLTKLSKEFEETQDSGNGMKKFLVNGQGIEDLIANDWANFQDEKERRKELKKKEGTNGAAGKTMMTTQLGNPSSRKRPMTPQRGAISTPKRLREMTIITPGKSPFVTPSAPVASIKVQKPNAGPSFKPPKGISHSRFIIPPNIPRAPNNLQVQSKKLVRKSMGRKPKKQTGSYFSSSITGEESILRISRIPDIQNFSDTNLVVDIDKINYNFPSLSSSQSSLSNGSRSDLLQPRNDNIANDNFSRPGTRSANKLTRVPDSSSASAAYGRKILQSKIPNRTTRATKEQIDPTKDFFGAAVVSPDNSYTEFTDHLLCQSTLNSSTVSSVMQNRKATVPAFVHSGSSAAVVVTPTKSNGLAAFKGEEELF